MELKDLLHIAKEAAVAAGKEILQVYNDPSQDFGIEKKADNSPLTIADKKAHECIARFLAETEIPVLSEEGRNIPYEERKEWSRLWVVDPLDGTKEFIKKNGEFTVNIALVVAGSPVLGVIYVPVKDVLYYGIVGENAWKKDGDAEPVQLPSDKGHEGYVIVASRSHMGPDTEAFVEVMREQNPDVRLISSGSSLKICLVAEGAADVYPRLAPTMEWDTAAGDAIARAAGCMVLNTDNYMPLVYNKEDLHNPWFLVE